TQLRRTAAYDRRVDLLPLGRGVRHRHERAHAPADLAVVTAFELDERRVDAVQRGAGDHADDLHAASRSPTRRATTPPTSSSRFRASSASRPSLPITMAVFTCPPDASSRPAAVGRSTPSTSIRIRWPRSRSFSQVTWRSTIRLPYTLPSFTIAAVLMVLSTIFVAVPAFMRVEPVITSGPTSGAITTSCVFSSSSLGYVHSRKPVRAPRSRARRKAPWTNGVVPDVAMPRTKSLGPTLRSSIARAPSSG